MSTVNMRPRASRPARLALILPLALALVGAACGMSSKSTGAGRKSSAPYFC